MDYDRADRIVGSYSDLLEKPDGRVWRPHSLLPATKEEIKAAILIVGLRLSRQGELSEEVLETLRTTYGMLADFVPDHTAKKITAYHKAQQGIRTALEGQVDRVPPVFDLPPSPSADIEAATDDFAALMDEFDRRFQSGDGSA